MKILVKPEQLKKVLVELLVKINLNEQDAKNVVDCYIEADLCGVHTHGIKVLPAHIEKIVNNIYNIRPEIKIIKENIAFSVVDGDNSIGPVSAFYGMNLAVEHAKSKGIYTVFSRNNNTLGPAFVYNNLALKEKMIGITITNSPAAMAPTNGKTKLFGTNPIAISIPTKYEKPIILDMATSTVAKSRIKQALDTNKKIPLDWATDSEGNPTENPEEAIKGLLLPMAGHKGYGLTMMVDVISGVLSGAGFLDNVGKFYGNDNCMNVGFTFIAMDPMQIYGEMFYTQMDEYVKTIKNSENIDGKRIQIPGENRLEERKNSLEKGLEFEEDIIIEIERYLQKYEIKNKIR